MSRDHWPRRTKRSRPVGYALSQSYLDMFPAKSHQTFVVAARVCLLGLLPLLGLGCEDASSPEAATTAATQKEDTPALPRIKWLDAHANVTPQQWLASRAAHADLSESDPKVEEMRSELNTAAKHFGDPPRMIANRAVQLEGMLAAKGIEESAPDLIKLLSSATSATGPKQGFGAVCQHYFNLRQQGVGRDAALQQLREANHLRPNNDVHRG